MVNIISAVETVALFLFEETENTINLTFCELTDSVSGAKTKDELYNFE